MVFTSGPFTWSCLALCSRVLFCFVLFGIVVASLAEERAALCASRAFICLVRVNFCPVSLPLCLRGWLWFVIVAHPGPFFERVCK